jgi:5-methyltetrahydropteroyltriglutamate--homocysteine methyltransferase
MRQRADRILTTHTGSLPRPVSLIDLYRHQASDEVLKEGLRPAVADVVAKQREVGIDIVNDGEYGKPMIGEVDYAAFTRYRYAQLTGYEVLEVEETFELIGGRDRRDFEEFYRSGAAAISESGRQAIARNVGPISYVGHDDIQRDIENLKAATADAGASGAFMAAIAPQEPARVGDHYATAEEEVLALAAALGEEYRAITDAGLILQIDDARLVAEFEDKYSIDWDLHGFRSWAARHLERLNHALEGIPAERVRYHVCWGSWKGPHSSDLPLQDIIDLILGLNVSQYVVEASNPRHEHEWEVWKDAKLPDPTIVVPGVVTHKTNVLEHPEVVAQRLAQYAGAVGRENVIAGTDCGMGGRIDAKLAWAKLTALSQGAELASKRLWKR